MVIRINPCVVAIVPQNADRIISYRLHLIHFQSRLEHLKGIGLLPLVALRLSAVGAGACGAGALFAQIFHIVIGLVAVAPINLNTLRFRYRYVFGIDHFIVSLLNSLYVAYAADAPDGTNHAFQLLLLFYFHRHGNDGAFAVALIITLCFKGSDVAVLAKQDAG